MHEHIHTNRPLEVPELLKIKEAAQKLNIEYRQLLKAVNEGVVPSYKLGKGRRLVSPLEVLQIMSNASEGGI